MLSILANLCVNIVLIKRCGEAIAIDKQNILHKYCTLCNATDNSVTHSNMTIEHMNATVATVSPGTVCHSINATYEAWYDCRGTEYDFKVNTFHLVAWVRKHET